MAAAYRRPATVKRPPVEQHGPRSVHIVSHVTLRAYTASVCYAGWKSSYTDAVTTDSRGRSNEPIATVAISDTTPSDNVAPLRPRTSRLRNDPVAMLSAARVRVMELLDEAGGPTAITTLSERSGYHPNTLREHLHALIEAGLVRSTSGAVNGRGRPPLLYETVSAEGARPQLRAYASLASALANHLARTSDDPAGSAVDAGREWGRSLAGTGEVPVDDDDDTNTMVVNLLTHLGFSPVGSGSVIRLGVCPFLAVATDIPSVVCNVHKGLLHGFTEAKGGNAQSLELRVFSADHSCEVSVDA